MSQPDDKLIDHLRRGEKILIFTGAGISTGSGIPDFRGPQGIWKQRQPVYYQDFMTSETARIEYWDYKLEGWEGFRDAQPNAVHDAIARLEQAGKVCMVVTQNIDGLHQIAGSGQVLLDRPAIGGIKPLVDEGRKLCLTLSAVHACVLVVSM